MNKKSKHKKPKVSNRRSAEAKRKNKNTIFLWIAGPALAVAAVIFVLTVSGYSPFIEVRDVSEMRSEADVPRMTIEKLKSMLGDPDLIILDVDWPFNATKIKGAVRENPEGVSGWYKKYPKDKTIVLY